MHGTRYEIEQSTPPGAVVPSAMVQTVERSSAILAMAILLPLALATLWPFVLLATHVVMDPSARALPR